MTEQPSWVPSGEHQHVSAQRMLAARARFEQRYDQALREREHLWVASVVFHVTPPMLEGTFLDADSMAFDPAVGCYICEQEWTAEADSRSCPGEPE